MEYRGYDSWGVAGFIKDSSFNRIRDVGGVDEKRILAHFRGDVGVGHTRWATTGGVSRENAHPVGGGLPRLGGHDVYVVHNGIVENHMELRHELAVDGYAFDTETDTEVIAHLLDREARAGHILAVALKRVLARLEGQSAFAALASRWPGKVLLAARGSPLLVSESGYAASDVAALAGYGEDCFRLPDGYLAVMQPGDVTVLDRDLNPVRVTPSVAVPAPAPAEVVDTFPHRMLAEIYEQPAVLRKNRTFAYDRLDRPPQVVLLGCGSSYNACLFARPFFESQGCVQTTVEYASEFGQRYLNLYPRDTLFVAVTQSGETRDTLAAMEHVNKFGRPLLSVTNCVASSADFLSGGKTIFLNAGPEYGVAATKTFTATCVALFGLAVRLANLPGANARVLDEELPRQLESLLEPEYVARVVEAAGKFFYPGDRALYLARGPAYAVAREGALKLKEVSYLHAEAIPAAEMKHGPLALVDDETVSVFVVPDDHHSPTKVFSNTAEVRARGGRVLAVADGDLAKKMVGLADLVLPLPTSTPFTQPLLANVVLQLLAYRVAVKLGRDVDRPRSLAKCVTVE